MHKYALAVQIDENLYEVFDVINVPDSATPSITRIENALNSGHQILGMKTTQFGNSVVHGAIWNGENFSGGNEDYYLNKNPNWSVSNSFSFLCNNEIFLISFMSVNTSANEMYDAAFSGNVTLIKVQEDQDVSPGCTWNGLEFSSLV